MAHSKAHPDVPLLLHTQRQSKRVREQKTHTERYEVATISRFDEIIGLFCRIASLLWGSVAKETYHFIDPTNISQSIAHKLLDMPLLLHT